MQKCRFWAPNFPKWRPQIFGQILYVALVPFSKKIAKPRGGPHKTPQEATICRTNNLLNLQMAIWNLKIGHLEAPIGHFEPKLDDFVP